MSSSFESDVLTLEPINTALVFQRGTFVGIMVAKAAFPITLLLALVKAKAAKLLQQKLL